jgi:hypothetical protein
MSASTQEIFNSLKKNGFDISRVGENPAHIGQGGLDSERKAVGVRVNKDEVRLKLGMRTWY